jgi:predicted transposase YbfD/YdcC
MPPVEVYKLILRGERKAFPKGFWEQPGGMENAKEVIKFLFEDILRWDRKMICTSLSMKIYVQYHLQGMISLLFNGSPINAVNCAYPGEFKTWEFSHVPRGFWKTETCIEAVKWLIEEKLKWDDEDIMKKLSAKSFRENGLGGMLSVVFKDSPFEAINLAYPGKFKPWELRQTQLGFWSISMGIEATKWLIEEKLKWTDEDVINKLSYDLFRKNGLGGMLQHVFDHSPFEAISQAYPNKFKAWEFKQTPKCFWTFENSVTAMKWLIEEKLKWKDEDIVKNLNSKVIKKNGLGGMLKHTFGNSFHNAINTLYPNKFRPWEFSNVPRKFWSNETGVLAVKWLVEEELKLNPEDIGIIKRLDFVKHGLEGMLVVVFNGNHKNALKAAYPEI